MEQKVARKAAPSLLARGADSKRFFKKEAPFLKKVAQNYKMQLTKTLAKGRKVAPNQRFDGTVP